MRCTQPYAAHKDRCVFTSIMLLGALFGLSAAPCARAPLVSAFVIIGVPLMTFGVAAPSRLGFLRELGLLLRGAEAGVLTSLLMAMGRFQAARAVRAKHRAHVENTYRATSERLAASIGTDPARLHHARRLAGFVATLAVLSGLALPFTHPATYTFGDGPVAIGVFLLDLVTLTVVGRVVGERVALRLLEATWALSEDLGPIPRVRALPLTAMLGAALGAVGALVIVSAGAAACAIETSWMIDANFYEPAGWFIRKTTPLALPLGIAAGAILGAGMGMAQSALLGPAPDAGDTD